jgi:hypothetical protein
VARKTVLVCGNEIPDGKGAAALRWNYADALKRISARQVECDEPTDLATRDAQLAASQLRIYPDSGHGFLDQYATLFADHVTAFLNGG